MISHTDLLLRMLEHNKHAIHPSRGKVNAQLVREVCEAIGANEDDFLPRHVLRDKRGWGLD